MTKTNFQLLVLRVILPVTELFMVSFEVVRGTKAMCLSGNIGDLSRHLTCLMLLKRWFAEHM